MANHKSALKRIRQNEKRRLYNRMFRSRARTYIKKARTLIDAGKSQDDAITATKEAMRELDMAAVASSTRATPPAAKAA
jgi:small subunit ribosomal protein S20